MTGIDFTNLSLKDALDLAVLIEEEARDRYEELAQQLTLHHTAEAAGFFTRMMRIEELHRTQLLAQRRKKFGDEPGTVRREMLYDVEAPDYDEVRAHMTLRDALETALRSERKAHRFFAVALEAARDAEVGRLFAELCREELEHERLVNVELDKLPADDPSATVEDDDDEPVSQ